jgi:hypothetical protein
MGLPVLLVAEPRRWLIDTAVDAEPPWDEPVTVEHGSCRWQITLAEVMASVGSGLFANSLESDAFAAVCAYHDFQPPRLAGFPWTGGQGSCSRAAVACLERTLPDGAKVIILLTAGEQQPGRFVAHLEGIWSIP